MFQEFPELMSTLPAKKVIKAYNKLARVFVEYEMLYHQAWVDEVGCAVRKYTCIHTHSAPVAQPLHANASSLPWQWLPCGYHVKHSVMTYLVNSCTWDAGVKCPPSLSCMSHVGGGYLLGLEDHPAGAPS